MLGLLIPHSEYNLRDDPNRRDDYGQRSFDCHLLGEKEDKTHVDYEEVGVD